MERVEENPGKSSGTDLGRNSHWNNVGKRTPLGLGSSLHTEGTKAKEGSW